MEKISSLSFKDKLIGVTLLFTLLSGVGAVVYGHVRAFNIAAFFVDKDSPDCIAASAMVDRKYRTGVKSVGYAMEYSFKTPDGRSFKQKDEVDINTYSFSKVGEQIEICYMKSNPRRSVMKI